MEKGYRDPKGYCISEKDKVGLLALYVASGRGKKGEDGRRGVVLRGSGMSVVYKVPNRPPGRAVLVLICAASAKRAGLEASTTSS
jgi:hypothetical protein